MIVVPVVFSLRSTRHGARYSRLKAGPCETEADTSPFSFRANLHFPATVPQSHEDVTWKATVVGHSNSRIGPIAHITLPRILISIYAANT